MNIVGKFLFYIHTKNLSTKSTKLLSKHSGQKPALFEKNSVVKSCSSNTTLTTSGLQVLVTLVRFLPETL